MKYDNYKAHITLEDGNTDSCTSVSLSDVVYQLGLWLNKYRVVKWSIFGVHHMETGNHQTELLTD